MENVFEGKISNQHPRHKLGGIVCARCSALIDDPEVTVVKGMKEHAGDKHNPSFIAYSYLTNTTDKRDHYIYPTTKGSSVCYCSRWCRDLHNHRYTK
jgi:hypothetical protein